ncbi:YiiX/YebB-like N1pC/P60 family cysteine hydrolase [Burkholderia sp. SIMBA_043]|uniref:YiiX/YebB-like N1pC/P60 family cysteine hydrolase n=1 Tax=Burkholderia TaxID=32008 RepID=UPI0005D9AD72|nr:YiiX/YebB-like N1pC/P60 family cysteine hydrolase [Burkholderia vietnamiensis]AJY07035.1 hypothetical protein AK36_2021 [Burkholderia vietnamiensis LMG 10929]AVR17198.1 hypothetical protein A8H33_28580 [Burkholderia vietnamiensis]UBI27576.1 hypothetical protein LA325_15450 [Burkholderia vietnamiensis]
MLIGDVLLVTGTSKISSGLVIAQKALYPKAVSSHVELSLGDGVFIHSTGDKGVHLSLITDELNNCNAGWRVIRLKGLDECGREEVAKAALYFIRQDYNKGFMGSGTDYSSFCSELVANSFARAGIVLFDGRMPSKVAPAHFDEQADAGELWEDVTAEYETLCANIINEPLPYKFALGTLQGALSKRSATSRMREGMFAAIEILAEKEGNERLKEIVEQAKRELKEGRTLDFWDEKDTE